ncbi:hypothetical protein NC653_019279 [Populus alba x Populus x berolinensis]|uniref:Secreted protein n=1 Tax=Populus alba x Populus x berolinensis TaxID=444605 RepID=A0AAD6VX09_9ROSI|nr:hypothetical protein NC653_019279 [Populus alba x Populus x berolinensis]
MGVAPDTILPLLLLTSLQAETKKGVSCLRFYVGIIIDARGRLRIGLMSDNQEERRLFLLYTVVELVA